MIDPYLNVLLNVIVVMTTIIIALLAAIILIRLLSSLNKQKYRIKSREWESIYLNYLHGDLTLEKAVQMMAGEKRYYWLWHFFNPYLEALEGTDFDKTKAFCREIGLIGHYKKKLNRGGAAKKAVAARVLGALRCRESAKEMMGLLQSRNQLLVQAAAQGLARSGQSDAFFPAAQALLRQTFITYEQATAILAAFGKEICPHIVRLLEDEAAQLPTSNRDRGIRSPKQFRGKNSVDPSVFRSIMVDLLGFFKYREALPLLERLLEKADEETTLHILKAFISIGEAPASLDLKPYLEHRYWAVRNFSARAWKLTGDRQVLPVLEKMLVDRNWWVRFHAAEALRSAGWPGLVILKGKTAEADRTAASVSSYVLNRGGVNGG